MAGSFIPGEGVPQYISIDVEGRPHDVSYAERDGWIEVRCEHGFKRAAIHEMPLKASERQEYVEGLARLLAMEIRH